MFAIECKLMTTGKCILHVVPLNLTTSQTRPNYEISVALVLWCVQVIPAHGHAAVEVAFVPNSAALGPELYAYALGYISIDGQVKSNCLVTLMFIGMLNLAHLSCFSQDLL